MLLRHASLQFFSYLGIQAFSRGENRAYTKLATGYFDDRYSTCVHIWMSRWKTAADTITLDDPDTHFSTQPSLNCVSTFATNFDLVFPEGIVSDDKRAKFLGKLRKHPSQSTELTP